MNAVIYARYSSDNQREESIEGQLRECKEYADQNGITVVRTYIDRALSAKTDSRPQFQQMIHDSATHTPLIIKGGGFDGGKAENRLTSLIDLPPTFLSLAGIPIPPSYMGKDLCQMQQTTQPLHDCVFMQISESQCGRAIRTDRFKYAVRTLAPTGYLKYNAGVYFEDYLYDLEKDPIERCNLIRDPRYSHIRQEMKYLLLREMKKAGEAAPVILPALKVRKK